MPSSRVQNQWQALRSYGALLSGTLAVVCATFGLVQSYATRVLFNSDAFAQRVAAALGHPASAAFVAERITENVIAQDRNLTAYKPVIQGAARAIVSSEPFRAIVRRAVRLAHRAVMSGVADDILLTVSDVDVVLRSALATRPDLAERIPSELQAAIGRSDQAVSGHLAVEAMQTAARWGFNALVLFGLALGLATACVWLSPRRQLAVLRLGLALTAVAVSLYLLAGLGGEALAHFAETPELAGVVVGLWQAFVGGFGTWVLVFGLIGLVMVAAATSFFERVRIVEWGRAAWAWLRNPSEKPPWAVARALVLLAAGLVAVLAPDTAMFILTFLAGITLCFLGLRELFAVLLRGLGDATARQGPEPSVVATRSWSGRRMLLVAAASIGLVTTAVTWLLRASESAATPGGISACNGFPELCDRTLDEVVFPATHNSMSAAEYEGWFFPNQEKGIATQLQDGIRGLLIDAYYGVPVGEQVKTVLEDEAAARRKYEAVLGKEGVDAAMRIRDRLVGEEEGERGTYLCHGLCELGALPLVSVLQQIREFLVLNPNEVLIIIIQDEDVAPRDIEAAFRDSGLFDFVYRGPVLPPWPTLRQMIASDQRVLVLAENDASGVAWYHPAFEVFQETPYRFHSPEAFSCEPGRGGTAGSLFLLNHWIDTTPAPLPANAEIVNAYDFLLDRARACQAERGRLPNLIAVDFYRTGNLFRVVETLNGMQPPGPPSGP